MATTNLSLPYLVSGQSQPEVQHNAALDIVDDAAFNRSGTVAARPAASRAGRLYLPTDGPALYRDSGSAWVPWGPLSPLSDPTGISFAWTNQGTATETTTGGSVWLNAANTANDQLRILDVAAPATPYTLTAAVAPMVLFVNFLLAGICLRDSAGGGIITWGVGANAAVISTGLALLCTKWTNFSTFSAQYTLTAGPQPAGPWMMGGLVWLRIADDGTTRTFSISNDGVHFLTLVSTTHTDFITPNRIGFFANANSATAVAAGINLISWKTS